MAPGFLERWSRPFHALLALIAAAFHRALDFARQTIKEALSDFKNAWPRVTESTRFDHHAWPPSKHRRGSLRSIIATARANLKSTGFCPMLSIDRAAGRA